ncbi:HAMP domain-containing protein [Luteimonas gilva]|uniref:histidine kinase n=1 Tax=Luteimonas gilva TaxID=2572684 RepID=A0A4U5JM62_9GAMM|nr:histidine kinase dimerization/phospho-acceptor domain-containing protein [Luteimonas gilva]TKR29621.1 HAMP domain-containing protein [Luteimonas gilva]
MTFAANLPLRRRVLIACTVLGLMLSLMFAAAVVYTADRYEAILIEEVLRGQAEDYSLRLVADPALPLPQTHRLSGYRRDLSGRSDIPVVYAGLSPGFHESESEDVDGIHVGVFDTDVGRLVFVMDLRDIEQLEQALAWFLAGMVVFGTALAGWLGWVFSAGTVAPVARLAKAVDALPTQPQPTALAESVSHDELGRLASAIDRYQARLVEADANERIFFADASHELRTPVAVVRGTAEVLLDGSQTDAGTRLRLRRLDRGMQELTDLLDVLLGLARRREPVPEVLDARELLQEAVSASAAADAQAPPVSIDAAGSLRLPRHESLLLLRGLIRRILPPEEPGRLAMRLDGAELSLAFVGEGARPAPVAAPPSQRGDRGYALTLTGRLAERLGWHWEQTGERALSIRLPQDAMVA